MKVRFSLTLLALLLPLPACDLIMPEPEPPPKVILMLLPGFMEFDPPDVRIARGEQLILKRWPLLWDPDIGPFPELAAGTGARTVPQLPPESHPMHGCGPRAPCVPGAVPDASRSVQAPSARHADPCRRVDDGCVGARSAVCQRRERGSPDRRGVAVERCVRRVRRVGVGYHRGGTRNGGDPRLEGRGGGMRLVVGVDNGAGRMETSVARAVRRLRAHRGRGRLLMVAGGWR